MGNKFRETCVVKDAKGKLKEIVNRDVTVYVEAGGEQGAGETVVKWEFEERQSKEIIT